MKTIIKIIIIFSFLFPNENKDFDYSENSFSMMKSMILPGWGEFDEYKKHKKDYILQRSRFFNYIEVGLVLSYLVSNKLSNTYESDYRTFATVEADVDWTNKNNAFAINVGKFDDTEAYNIYCNSPGIPCDGQYDLNDSSFHWSWDNNDDLLKYSFIREDSKEMEDLATLMLAGLLINRLASFFDVIAIKKKEENLFSFNIEKDNTNTSLFFSYNF